jgi:hypothetical protein
LAYFLLYIEFRIFFVITVNCLDFEDIKTLGMRKFISSSVSNCAKNTMGVYFVKECAIGNQMKIAHHFHVSRNVAIGKAVVNLYIAYLRVHFLYEVDVQFFFF